MPSPRVDVFSWLPRLVSTLALIDEAVELGRARQSARLGLDLVCAKGCDACCRGQVIPVSLPEMAGAVWHLRSRATARLRRAVEERWAAGAHGRDCPFLLDGICAVRPMRFMACRQFNVFGRPCESIGYVLEHRPEHLLAPDRERKRQALTALMPLYGFPGEQDLDPAHLTGFIRRISRPLSSYDLGNPEVILRAANATPLPLSPESLWDGLG